MLGDWLDLRSAGASKTLNALGRFEGRVAACQSQHEIVTSLCEAFTWAGYARVVVGHWVGDDTLRVLPVAESPVREVSLPVDLSGGVVETFRPLSGANPHVLETTIFRPTDSQLEMESLIAVAFPWHGCPKGVLVVGSSEPGGFGPQERAAMECVAVHLSLSLQIVGQRLAIESGEGKYRRLVENINEVVYIATADGRITYVNPAIEQVLGVPAAAVLGEGFDRFVAAEDRAAIWEGFRRQRRGDGRPVVLRVKDAAGRPRVLRASLFPAQTEAGDLVGVASDVTELVAAQERLLSAFEGTVRALGRVTVARDPYTAMHQERVARLAAAVAEEMSLDAERVRAIRCAGLVHDIGKVSVPAEILNKPTALSGPERMLLDAHPTIGYQILSEIDFPWPIADTVLQHHERLDGSGYPHRLLTSDISLDARVLAVADVVEAMGSHRPYRPARSSGAARNEITSHAGDLYDRDVVAACLRVLAREEKYTHEEADRPAPPS